MPAKSGFTMIEMIFVLAITMTLMAISLPVASRSVSPSLEKQAHQIVAQIDHAKTNSQLNHIPTTITMTGTIMKISDNQQLDLTYELHNCRFSKNIELDFNKSGHINQANTIELVAREEAVAIVVNLATGHSYVRE